MSYKINTSVFMKNQYGQPKIGTFRVLEIVMRLVDVH